MKPSFQMQCDQYNDGNEQKFEIEI
jgi:hypothetical protein